MFDPLTVVKFVGIWSLDHLWKCLIIFGYVQKFSVILTNAQKIFRSVHVAFRQVLENLQKSLESDRKSWKIVITSLLQCSMFISDNFISVLTNNWPNCYHEQSLENWMTSQVIASMEAVVLFTHSEKYEKREPHQYLLLVFV